MRARKRCGRELGEGEGMGVKERGTGIEMRMRVFGEAGRVVECQGK